jgi:hypothetical protein
MKLTPFYTIPKADQYMVDDKRYFKMILPPEAKLYKTTSSSGSEYIQVNLRDMQLTSTNLKVQPIPILRAIVKHILKMPTMDMNKRQLMDAIIQNMQYE